MNHEPDRTAEATSPGWAASERRNAEEALRKSEQQFRVLVENVNAGVALIDETGRFSLFNRRFLAMFGLSSDSDVRNVNDQDWSAWQVFDEQGRLLHVDEHPVRKAALTGRPVRDALVEVQLPGTTTRMWMLVSAAPLLDESRRPASIICTYSDITKRKRAELALRESEARFRSVLDGSRDVIYRVDAATGRYEYISPSCAALVGFSAEELAALDAESSLAMIHPDDLPAVRAAIERLQDTGSEQVEYRQRTRSGDYLWMSNHMSLVRDAVGRPLCRDGNIRDITGQKRLEQALQQTVSELEHVNHVKDEFLATLSHELRTPLNAILGWSDMVLRAGLPPDVQRKALESIRRNAQAQAALISDILDMSRIITGKLRLDIGPVDLADVVAAACEAVQPAADAKGIDLRISVAGRPILLGDAERLQQIVWNLLSNSVKFSGHGGRVGVVVRAIDFRVEIEVSDEGAGIAADFLPHVFERFRQRDSSTTRRQGGLGLGLAIVRSLAELHGGTATAFSEGEGKGATFTVRLPVRATLDGGALDESGRLQQAACETDGLPERCLEGLHIVVVDDEEEARSLIQAVLERCAARVTTCSTAEEALAAVTRERPDLLLADVGMPDCDGYDLVRRVRARPASQDLPAIALTAYGGAHDRAQALSAGFWEHLAKPVLPGALVNAVAAVAASRKV